MCFSNLDSDVGEAERCPCRLCGKSYKTKDILNSHMKIKHKAQFYTEKMTKKREKLLAKTTCNLGFKESKSVEKLIPSREIRHCSACCQGFEKMAELVGHYRANPSHFPYSCGNCSKLNKKAGTSGKHKKRSSREDEDEEEDEEEEEDGESGQIRFPCPKCSSVKKTHLKLVEHQVKMQHFDR